MVLTSCSAGMSVSSFHSGLFSAFAHKSQIAFTTAAVDRCTTPFSGPIQRYWLSLVSAPPQPGKIARDRLQAHARQHPAQRLNRLHAKLRPSTARKRQPVPFESVAIGAQNDVRRRIVRVLVHRVRTIRQVRSRKPHVEHLPINYANIVHSSFSPRGATAGSPSSASAARVDKPPLAPNSPN